MVWIATPFYYRHFLSFAATLIVTVHGCIIIVNESDLFWDQKLLISIEQLLLEALKPTNFAKAMILIWVKEENHRLNWQPGKKL